MSGRIKLDRVKRVLTISAVIFSLLVLLAPVAILYLVNPRKGVSAAIVLLFGILFTVVISNVQDIKLETVCIGLSAYMAVLVTFLANLQGGQ
jgi:hypothetical protein